MKWYENIKLFSLLNVLFFLQIHLSFSQQCYKDSDQSTKFFTYSIEESPVFLAENNQNTDYYYPVQSQPEREGIILSDTIKILWTNPSNKTTKLKSASAKIKATINSPSGISSVVLYLNDMLYGEPEMNPSKTELGSFDLFKSLNFEPGENSVYFMAICGKDTVTSEKRYFIISPPLKNSDKVQESFPASLSIKWINPAAKSKILKSASANILATVKAPNGLNSVILYLNDVRYGEPEMNPSPTELGSFDLNKSLNFEPGENSVYFVAVNNTDTAVSEKRYFIIPTPEKNADSVKVILPAPPVITWTNPSGKKTKLNSSSEEISATVKSASGLTSVIIYLNNVSLGEAEIKQSPGATDSYIIEKTLSFNQVENNIYLEAKNAGGSTSSDARYFICPVSSLTANKKAIKATPGVIETTPIITVSASKINETNAGVTDNASKKNEFTSTISENATLKTENPKVEGRATAPIITWTSPSGSNTNLDTYNATVKASIKSKSGLNSVLLYLNGISKGEADVKPSPNEIGSFLAEKNINFGPGENNIYLVATNREGATKSELRYFTNPTAVAPVISWSNPATNSVLVNAESVNIEASIKSPTSLKSIKVIINGETQIEDNVIQTSSSDNSIYNYRTSVILKKGDNSIYINATNIAGSKISDQRVIKYEAIIAEKRLALVIGNSEYKKGATLKNPVNDANLMEATLKELGFDVIKRLNAGKETMMAAIKEYTEKLPKYNVILFYYAGHGNQVDGKNYLIPTDALLENPIDCKFEAIAVDFVVDEFERYPDNTNIVILDACRNNPYASWARGGDIGFRQVTFTSGTIVAFATSEGATAADGNGANGLYTEELVKQMTIPQSLHNVFLNTRTQVRKLSNNQQVPMEWDKLNSDFYLKK